MSMKLDAEIRNTGTRFRIFPQPHFLEGFEEPETIWVSVPPDRIGSGPADDRMYVIDAIDKNPYGYPYLPPHMGDKNPPVEADLKSGHFDHLDVESREFKSAQMYATVRRVLDIWEDYFGRRIQWHFALHYDRMELIPLIEWDNAHSGYGFLEFGYGRTSWGGMDLSRPYCLNFDVLAHELGHSIVFAEVGAPNNSSNTPEYGGFHEAAGDLVAIVSALHSELVVGQLLNHSRGNLFTVNELNRVGDLSKSREIRRAFNWDRMSTVSLEPHDLSRPLTGAIFDIFVEVFQKNLVSKTLISQELADLSYHGPDETIDDEAIQAQFDAAYEGQQEGFKTSLLEARDYLGGLLAIAFDRISPHYLSYVDVGLELLAIDSEVMQSEHQDTIRDCFAWREISFPADSLLMKSRRVTDCHLQPK